MKLIATALLTLALSLGATASAAPDPALAACDQAVAEGIYTVELLSQCYDDFREAGRP